jgi:hypothetical protein
MRSQTRFLGSMESAVATTIDVITADQAANVAAVIAAERKAQPWSQRHAEVSKLPPSAVYKLVFQIPLGQPASHTSSSFLYGPPSFRKPDAGTERCWCFSCDSSS